MDVFAGDVATFSCEVSCAGGPEACWWLDGTLLQDSPQSAICVHDGTVHSLTLSGLGVADSGTITYRAGPLVSTAKLLVKGTSQWDPARTNAFAITASASFLQAPGQGVGDWHTCAMCGHSHMCGRSLHAHLLVGPLVLVPPGHHSAAAQVSGIYSEGSLPTLPQPALSLLKAAYIAVVWVGDLVLFWDRASIGEDSGLPGTPQATPSRVLLGRPLGVVSPGMFADGFALLKSK